MKNKNIVILEGRVGNDLKYKKTKEGRVFATFTLEIDSFDKLLRDTTESHSIVYIRIMVFDINIIRYMQRVKIKQGNIVNIFARLNNHIHEHKGETICLIDVVVRDLHLVQRGIITKEQ
jgi:hypothetical protein